MGKKVKAAAATTTTNAAVRKDSINSTGSAGSKASKGKASKVDKVQTQKVVEQVESVEHSEKVLQKIENAKLMAKQVKAMKAQVLQSLDVKQVAKAVKALQGYVKAKREKSGGLLDEEDEYINLSFTMTQVPTNPSARPFQVNLPHPFHSESENSRICVFVKDPAREFKDQIQELNIPCIAKVIGYDKLKRNFKQYKDRRQLLKDYDAFLSDLRVYKMLPECLGKEFYSKKKFPCPLKLHGFTKEELAKQLNRAAEATFYTLGNGPNYSVRIGKTSQKPNEVGLNAQEALANALAYTTVFDDIAFDQVCQVAVKVGDSPELPVYNYLSQEDIEAYTTASQSQ